MTAQSPSGRQNNFNVLRLVAASLVIVAHGIELPTGLASRDIAYTLTGQSFGWYAVSMFFTISGYLVLGSWNRNPSVAAFLRNRVLRIWPGLIVMLILSVALLGLFFSTLTPRQFFTATQSWSYFLGNFTIVGVRYELPGVFASNPLTVVNGSLWTLRYEIGCYAALAGLGALGLLSRREPRKLLLIALTLAAAGASIAIALSGAGRSGRMLLLVEGTRLTFAFLLGMFYRDWSDRFPPRLPVLALLVIVAGLTVKTVFFVPLAILALAYATFWVAFVPDAPWLRAMRRTPDYSYGLYIYAFPVQQAIIAAYPQAGAATVIILGLALTLVPAALSWHFVEEPALRHKSGSAHAPIPFSVTEADHAS